MVDYLFLIPLSPSDRLDADRAALQELCFGQIRKLQSTYHVFTLGDRNHEHPGFKSFALEARTKEEKLRQIAQYCTDLPEPIAKYVVRLDDDDLINPEVFDALANRNFEMAFDRQHCFYDLASARCSQQKRPWIANTAIHAWGDAFEKIPVSAENSMLASENWLIACDHSSAWAIYYAHKEKLAVDNWGVLYLRVLSPKSITAQASDAYGNYLAGFGGWDATFPLEPEVHDALRNIWIANHGPIHPLVLPKKSFLSRIKHFRIK